jgi:hypothetical protein
VHHFFFDVWSTKVRDLKEFGVGHMLYFYFLNWMAALFLVLTLMVGIPNMLLNYEGRWVGGGWGVGWGGGGCCVCGGGGGARASRVSQGWGGEVGG